jgi:uncharacterized protein (DUF927 family)
VTIWPDHDEPGTQAAAKIAQVLSGNSGQPPVKIMEPLTFTPGRDEQGVAKLLVEGFIPEQGWDAADAVAAGWTAEHIALLPAEMFKVERVPGPTFEYGQFIVSDEGVEIIKQNAKGDKTWHERLSSRIDVVALTRDDQGLSWGKVLNFLDCDGNIQEWVLPSTMLAGSGEAYRKILMDLGCTISSSSAHRTELGNYLQAVNPDARALCVDKIGWHGNVYVLPGQNFGVSPTGERTILQTEAKPKNDFSSEGTLSSWQNNVASLCRGNSRLILSLAIGLAGPFLKSCGHENFGVHLRGGSSLGKTKAMTIAASIWGRRDDMMGNWRTTDNSLENIALHRNDNFLMLDEIAQISPPQIGDSVYMLGNGAGKSRSSTTGQSRDVKRFRLVYLSTGEISVATHLESAGQVVKAGHEVRLIELPADATGTGSMFQDTHGIESHSQFADTLEVIANQHHGNAGLTLLEHLTQRGELERASTYITNVGEQFAAMVVPAGADGQVSRVAAHLGLLAGVGEYAIQMGILPWDTDEVFSGIQECFQAWMHNRGGTESSEEIRALEQIRRILESDGESRFEALMPSGIEVRSESITRDRLGYRKRVGDQDSPYEYWVLPVAFKSVLCAGFDRRTVANMLMEKGLLRTRGRSPFTTERIPGLGATQKVYVITPAIFEYGGPELATSHGQLVGVRTA